MSYRPSHRIFPVHRAAISVIINGSTYCMSPVASSMITVSEIVILAIPPSAALKT